MDIPNVTPYSGQKPVPGQDQPTFNQNMSDELDYFNALPAELNPAINAINQTATDVDNAKTAAETAASEAATSATAAAASGNYQGEFTSGVTSATAGESYSFGDSTWLCLVNTTTDPAVGNVNWRKVVSVEDVNEAEERLLGPGAKIYRGSNGKYVQDGDNVPTGTTHLTVLINGKPEDVSISPLAAGVVSALTETVATIGGVGVKFYLSEILSYPSVDFLKNGSGINPNILDYFDVLAKTDGYRGGLAAMLEPQGAAEYVLTTRQKVRDAKSDPLWEPDGYGDHYLFGGTDYVAVLRIKDGFDVAQFGADVTGGEDSSPNFVAAINRMYELFEDYNTLPSKYSKITGPSGSKFLFNSQIISPDFATPNYNRFDLDFEGCTFIAGPSFDMSTNLIHARAVRGYSIKGITFQGFTQSFVVFIDSSRENNSGDQALIEDVRFLDCEYGVSHELESVVLTLRRVTNNVSFSMKQLLSVWRADQIVFDECYFNWEQAGLSVRDAFIELNHDRGVTNESGYPGDGRYNVPRISVRNSMFIPVGVGVTPVHTAWFALYGGLLTIEDSHFGPESNNRPSIVFNYSIGATYSSVTDLTDSGIVIKNCSCPTSYDLVYCVTDYPNIIHIENIRWNVLAYQSISNRMVYYIGGDFGVLNAKSRYGRPNAQYFEFKIDCGTPAYRALNDIDPRCEFPHVVTSHSEFSVFQSTDSNLPSTLVFYDLNNRNSDGEPNGQMPAVPPAGSYEVKHAVTVSESGVIKEFTMVNNLRLIETDGVISGSFSSVVAAPLGSTPTVSLSFIMPNGTQQSTVTRAEIDNLDRIFMRISYTTNNGSNTWQAASLKMKRM